LKEYFENDEQFEVFLEKLREKLPCVFRINPANSYYKQFKQILEDSNFLSSFTNCKEEKNDKDTNDQQPENNDNESDELKEEEKILSDAQPTNPIAHIKITPFNLTNIPKLHNMIYNINIPRFELKRNSALSKFHIFIQKSVDSGLISRQEAVSMIPPILMEVSPGESVFDTCAAPGSKTAQLLEEFYRDFDFLNPTSILNDSGIVLANDNNYNRAYMMSHQLKRLNTSGMMIISHDAQFFPTIFKENDERYLFDKILCDVPCSSDAVLRKLPHKWRIWSPRDSFSLHKLQLQILKRGISLLKIGGRLVYSTCSLNPIEVIILNK
jgi:16S rRNA C967 or C1407 C5-methylase (RsmB/RsmF family)